MWRNAARARAGLPEYPPDERPGGITGGIGYRIVSFVALFLCSRLRSSIGSARDSASPLTLGGTS